MDSIYLDHAATTPLHPDVNKVMFDHAASMYGNPSSVHAFGRESRKAIDQARNTIATSIQAHETEITFTSGGTEAINSALIGVALANKANGNHLITTNQEHQATLNTMRYLETIGFDVTYIPTDLSGRIAVGDVERSMTEQTILLSMLMVNNETGVKLPVEELGQLCKEKEIPFHVDAVQAFGPLPINVDDLAIDLMTISAHKINGPKGIGALYTRKGTRIQPIQFGGEQERKARPGTENIVGIIGFGRAVQELIEQRDVMQRSYQDYNEMFFQTLADEGVQIAVNGDRTQAVPGIVNISFPGTHVESFLMNLDIEGIAASSGSACTAGTVEGSHVLEAMFGADSERVTNSIRFSFGMNNEREQIKEAAKRIAAIVKRIKQ